MRRTAVVCIALLLAGCGNGSSAESSRWIDQFDADLEQAEPGVWLDKKNETVYVENCAKAQTLTSAGGAYGPTDKPGWAYICDD